MEWLSQHGEVNDQIKYQMKNIYNITCTFWILLGYLDITCTS